MIGESVGTLNQNANKGLIALRDAIIVFLLLLVTGLIETPGVPTLETFYRAVLPALLMGIISYMHALGIKKPET